MQDKIWLCCPQDVAYKWRIVADLKHWFSSFFTFFDHVINNRYKITYLSYVFSLSSYWDTVSCFYTTPDSFWLAVCCLVWHYTSLVSLPFVSAEIVVCCLSVTNSNHTLYGIQYQINLYTLNVITSIGCVSDFSGYFKFVLCRAVGSVTIQPFQHLLCFFYSMS